MTTRFFSRLLAIGAMSIAALPAPSSALQTSRTTPAVAIPGWLSTYFGGSGTAGDERIDRIVIDPLTQDFIVVGVTNSADAPITGSAADATFAGATEGFVARFDASLHILLAATFFGGGGFDEVYGVDIDPLNGDILVVGYSDSPTLPGTAGGAQSLSGGAMDAFVARLSPDLRQIRQTSFLGAAGNDFGINIKIRAQDRSVFIVGSSNSPSLPASASGAQPVSAGGQDGFVARFSPDLKTLWRTTYQGGNGFDDLFDLWIDPVSHEIVVMGLTASTNLGSVAGSAQPQLAGGNDVQLARFSSTLSQRIRASYYGGMGNESANAMVFDPPTGGLLICGLTYSTSLPGAVGTVQSTSGGNKDGFVVRFATDLSARGRASFVGGDLDDIVYDLLVQNDGQIVMFGSTISSNFPGTWGATPGVATGFIVRTESTMLGTFSSIRVRTDDTHNQSITGVQLENGNLCVGGIIYGAGLPGSFDGAQSQFGGGSKDGYISCVNGTEFPLFTDGFDRPQ